MPNNKGPGLFQREGVSQLTKQDADDFVNLMQCAVKKTPLTSAQQKRIDEIVEKVFNGDQAKLAAYENLKQNPDDLQAKQLFEKFFTESLEAQGQQGDKLAQFIGKLPGGALTLLVALGIKAYNAIKNPDTAPIENSVSDALYTKIKDPGTPFFSTTARPGPAPSSTNDTARAFGGAAPAA